MSERVLQVYGLGNGSYPFLNNSMVLRADKAVALHQVGDATRGFMPQRSCCILAPTPSAALQLTMFVVGCYVSLSVVLQAGTDGEYWSTDWYQAGISRPDIAVEDIFGYLSPDAATPGRESHFFRNIATGELPKVMTLQ